MDFGTSILVITIAAGIGLALWAYAASAIAHDRKKRESWTRYQTSLRRLKADPTNASLRESALAFGRSYSQVTREEGKVALYDEVAIMNDIGAACAAAAVQPSGAATNDYESDPPMHRFRIRGAEKDTGADAVFEIDADTVQEARKKASEAGFLVEKVEMIG